MTTSIITMNNLDAHRAMVIAQRTENAFIAGMLTASIKALKAEREFLKNAMDFFKELFKLKPKQIEHIYKQVPGDTLNLYVSYVCGCVKGATGSFADFEKDVKKEQESAPKGDPATSND